MRIRFALPPKSMWLPVGIIMLTLTLVYLYAAKTSTGARVINSVRNTLAV